ncbi:probable polyamine oxidase 5 [Tribolium madens]|uniref:probable polyamine oxidase 5 n=1 Tax=Tribolium madens TaxID=41895 RepID=UPI001CF753C5|nr:probable polyamine oxidase 5 [Tribolium madens]
MSWSLVLFFCVIGEVFGNFSVIVIGAGPSGIAAATKLLQNSVNVTILEAESRIGGRINTVKFGDGLVELGAEYCHGEEGNIVKELVKDYDLLEPTFNYLNGQIYYSNGSKLNHEFVRELQDLILSENKEENYDTRGKSIGEVFMHRYNSTLVEKYKTDPNKLKLLKEGLHFAERTILISEGSFSWFDASADSDWLECPGNQTLVWKGVGYKTILEILMKNYPNPAQKLPLTDNLLLDSKVTKINWGEKPLKVHTSLKVYSADFVIFTPSIGVLKAGGELFTPPLPSKKRQAIDSIGFGGVVKLFLRFPVKWWSDNDKYFAFFWSETDLESENFPQGPRKNGKSWVTQLLDLSRVGYNTNVWMIWISGEMVPEIEKLSLEILKQGVKFTLEKFLGKDYNITEIGEVLRSNWVANENFRGTYSFTRKGLYQKGVSYQNDLGEPLQGLLFAGEATNPVHFATVHGAIESGHREAQRILDLQNKN